MPLFSELQSHFLARIMSEFVNCPSSLETEQSLDVMSHFDAFSGIVMENSNLGLMCYSGDNFLPLSEQFSGLSSIECLKPIMNPNFISSAEERRSKLQKRKAEATNSVGSSATAAETAKKKNSLGSVKRGRSNSNEVEKGGEVVHVRARRGQATDSHSLAERVRREKINERMRCLQDLVPGCCKTMGMTSMLDEIINYVQSLQNQVEFLSMKLTAASSFYDFNFDIEPTATQQVLPWVGDAYEAQEMEPLMMGEGYEGITSFQSTMPF